MRCHAYMLPKEGYRELEAQILEQLRDGDREQLLYLLEEHDLEVELLSGEWRVLFSEATDFYQVVDADRGIARMAISPEELSEFVELLRDEDRRARWEPIAFGLDELVDALPVGVDLEGLVFVEESDDWQWEEKAYEMVAIRPEVFDLLQPHLQALLDAQDHAALGRLASDHSEGEIEFSPAQWQVLLEQARHKVPELLAVFDGRIMQPSDYTSIREALALISEPRYQPSLDAWLRVHAEAAQYALFIRDANAERGIFADAADPHNSTIQVPASTVAAAVFEARLMDAATDVDADEVTVPESEPEPDPEEAPGPEPQPESEPEAEWEPEPESETEPDRDPEPEQAEHGDDGGRGAEEQGEDVAVGADPENDVG